MTDFSVFQLMELHQTIFLCVTQGSVLGPLFFLLYINDMPNTLKAGPKVVMFADDSVPLISSNKSTDLCH